MYNLYSLTDMDLEDSDSTLWQLSNIQMSPNPHTVQIEAIQYIMSITYGTFQFVHVHGLQTHELQRNKNDACTENSLKREYSSSIER